MSPQSEKFSQLMEVEHAGWNILNTHSTLVFAKTRYIFSKHMQNCIAHSKVQLAIQNKINKNIIESHVNCNILPEVHIDGK